VVVAVHLVEVVELLEQVVLVVAVLGQVLRLQQPQVELQTLVVAVEQVVEEMVLEQLALVVQELL
jgi:hypothetical protein